MKFVLTKDYLYWWPVTVEMPHADLPGKWVKHSFTMQFAFVDPAEAKALAKQIAELPEDQREGREHDLLVNASRDWRDIVDDDKQPVPFSAETLREALRQPWFRAGVYNAYARSLASEEARKGN